MAAPDLGSDPRETRREEEGFEPPISSCKAMREMEEHARVSLHGTADVTQQHDRPRPDTTLPAWQAQHFAARAKTAAERSSNIDLRTGPRDPTVGPAFSRGPHEMFERCACEGDLAARELGKILVGEPRNVAPGVRMSDFRAFAFRDALCPPLPTFASRSSRTRSARRLISVSSLSLRSAERQASTVFVA